MSVLPRPAQTASSHYGTMRNPAPRPAATCASCRMACASSLHAPPSTQRLMHALVRKPKPHTKQKATNLRPLRCYVYPAIFLPNHGTAGAYKPSSSSKLEIRMSAQQPAQANSLNQDSLNGFDIQALTCFAIHSREGPRKAEWSREA